jgi:hypothetical protein
VRLPLALEPRERIARRTKGEGRHRIGNLVSAKLSPPILGRSTVAQMRRAIAFRNDTLDTEPRQVQAQANTSWWVASLSVPELKGWLEIDDDWRPIACGVVDDLRWVAPPGAGNGWTMTYDKEFVAGDSYKVRAQRDRCPPGSKISGIATDFCPT